MAVLDRDLQLRILTQAAEAFPKRLFAEDFGFSPDDTAWVRNAMYLADPEIRYLRFDRGQAKEGFEEGPFELHSVFATAAGIDFLEDDGGLTAVRSVVTVKLEAETLRALIVDRIEASTLPKEEKGRLVKALEHLKKKGLEEMNSRLVKFAADHIADPETWRKLFDGLGKAGDLLSM